MGGPVGCPRGRGRREAGHGVSSQPCDTRAHAAARGHALTSASGVRFGGNTVPRRLPAGCVAFYVKFCISDFSHRSYFKVLL